MQPSQGHCSGVRDGDALGVSTAKWFDQRSMGAVLPRTALD